MVLLAPTFVATDTLSLPRAAVEAIVRVAVSEVELVTLTLLTVMPPPTETCVAPAVASKFEPAIVTTGFDPRDPLDGEMDVIVGRTLTANGRVLLEPCDVERVTLY